MNEVKYYAYIRVSTPRQGEEGVSLQEQKDAIQRYADRHGLQIVQWFEERETAAKCGRPVFSEAMKLLRQKRAAGIIIHKIDRSARNLKDWAELAELMDRGIQVFFAHESLDMNTRGGRLAADVQAVVAADYIRNLKEEVRKGLYGRVRQGLYPLRAPLGYLNMGGGKPKAVDPKQATLVRKAFELYASGRYTLKQLVEEMYTLGLRTQGGKGKVPLPTMSMMLKNPFYVGIVRMKNETNQGVHVPIIPKTLFDRVERVSKQRDNLKSYKHDFQFRLLLRCGSCGYALRGELQKGRVYYRCHSRSCPTTSIREDNADCQIYEQLLPVQFADGEKPYPETLLREYGDDLESKRRVQEQAITAQLGYVKDRLSRLTDALIDQLLEKEVFEAKKKELLMQRVGLQEKLAKLKDGLFQRRLSELVQLLKVIANAYRLASIEQRRDLLKIVGSNRRVNGKKLDLVLAPPFETLAKRYQFYLGGPDFDYGRMWRELFPKLVEQLALHPIEIPDSLKTWPFEGGDPSKAISS